MAALPHARYDRLPLAQARMTLREGRRHLRAHDEALMDPVARRTSRARLTTVKAYWRRRSYWPTQNRGVRSRSRTGQCAGERWRYSEAARDVRRRSRERQGRSRRGGAARPGPIRPKSLLLKAHGSSWSPPEDPRPPRRPPAYHGATWHSDRRVSQAAAVTGLSSCRRARRRSTGRYAGSRRRGFRAAPS